MTAAESSARPTGRDEVIEAAIVAAADQLVTVGPARMTVRTVAEAAGVNHALIHRHLETKERLIAAALDRLAAESFAEVESGTGGRLHLTNHPCVRRYVLALSRCLLDEPALPSRQRGFPVLQKLIDGGVEDGSDPETAAARSVAWLCAVFGAELFGHHLSDAANIKVDDEGGPLDVIESALGPRELVD